MRALGLFDLMAPLALEIAAVDGQLAPPERAAIRDYFVRAWGYDAAFVAGALPWTEARLGSHSLPALARTLAALQRDNPDCDAAAMSAEILRFLREVAAVDGPPGAREEAAVARVARAFADAARPPLLHRLRRLGRRVAARIGRPRGRAGRA